MSEEEFVITSIDEAVSILNELSKQLVELKAENERLKEDYDEVYEDVYNRVSEEFKLNNGYDYQMRCASHTIEELQEQLKEKEQEIERYSELFGMKDKDYYVVEKEEYEKMKKGAKELINQAKIDTTKQVCDKIKIESPYCHINGENYFKVYPEILK